MRQIPNFRAIIEKQPEDVQFWTTCNIQSRPAMHLKKNEYLTDIVHVYKKEEWTQKNWSLYAEDIEPPDVFVEMKDTGEKENDAGRAISDDIGDIMEEAEIASTEASREQSRANSTNVSGNVPDNTQKAQPPQSYELLADDLCSRFSVDLYTEDQKLAMTVKKLAVTEPPQPQTQDPTPEEANKIGGRGRGRGRGRVNF